MGTGAGSLLTGVSVYREAADRNAVLFQVGLHDRAAARAPDTRGPTPPYRPPANLAELTAACVHAGLLSQSHGAAAGTAPAVFVDRGIAVEVHEFLATAGRAAELADAHRRAGAYWQWRAAAWPQGRAADISDLLEARHHLLSAGDLDQVSTLTADICAQLRAWGDLDRESELVQATLDAMPSPSAGRARWLHELAAIAQARGDQAAAEDRYLESVRMFTEVGDAGSAARGYESLGVLAQALGDYRKAERHYREAAGSSPAAAGGAAGAGADATAQSADPPRRSHRARRPGRSGWLGPPAVLVALPLAVALTATIAVTRLANRTAPAASPAADVRGGVGTGQRTQAATWVAQQVSRSAIVACDPAMCAALRAHGKPGGNLLTLGPGAQFDPLRSDVVVATAAVRSEFGTRLAGVYAPLVLASFGTGSAQVEVRATAPEGATAYRRARSSDQLARRTAGATLMRNGQLTVAPAARRALAAGRVDSRLLTTIAALARMWPLRVIGFADGGPGAGPAAPLRSAELAPAAPGTFGALVAFLRAQHPPYLATSISVTRPRAGQPVLRFAFGDPSPLGLLAAAGRHAAEHPAAEPSTAASLAAVNTGPGPR